MLLTKMLCLKSVFTFVLQHPNKHNEELNVPVADYTMGGYLKHL